MRNYEALTIEIFELSSEDIITTSSPFNGKDDEIPDTDNSNDW